MRVLYIDDDKVNALLFVETCRFATGVEVMTAHTGQEALDLISEWRPELLVIDLHLPDTDGYRLLRDLRERVGQPQLPAFLCTADEAQRVGTEALAAGFEGCWSKPVDLAMVLNELNTRQAQTRTRT